MNKKILFVSHDATRTGAPMVLLHFLEWLKASNSPADFSILLLENGEMEERFRKVATTYAPRYKNSIQRGVIKVINRLLNLKKTFVVPTVLKKEYFDIIYLNTIVSAGVVAVLKNRFRCPVVCHAHENEYTIRMYHPHVLTKETIECIDHFIAVSDSTKNHLIEQYHIDPAKISKVYEFIPVQTFKHPTVDRFIIQNELQLGNAFVVGASGLTSWRKGVDLFVQLASELKKMREHSKIKLVWVGEVSYEFQCQLAYEAKRLGIQDDIIFTGSKPLPQNYFQLFDVFALMSREDPFPLVAIEAASMQKPIVCFSDSGGIPEFAGRSNGILTVPYGNVAKMAEVILQLMHDQTMRKELGAGAASLVNDFDVSIAGQKLLGIINHVTGKP